MEQKKYISFLFFIILFSSFLPYTTQAQLSSHITLSSQGSIAVNLAVIPDDWGLTYGSGPQIIYLDYNVTHNGHVSVRLEPHTANDVNTARECDGTWYLTKPGDHIVAKCWIKTDNSTPAENADPYHGGRIGIDLYGSKPDGSLAGIVDGYPHDGAEHLYSMVMWGTTVWTQKTWDFIIPSTIYTKTTSGQTIDPTQVTHIVMWMQAMQVNDGTAIGNAWFADAELYIYSS